MFEYVDVKLLSNPYMWPVFSSGSHVGLYHLDPTHSNTIRILRCNQTSPYKFNIESGQPGVSLLRWVKAP